MAGVERKISSDHISDPEYFHFTTAVIQTAKLP